MKVYEIKLTEEGLRGFINSLNLRKFLEGDKILVEMEGDNIIVTTYEGTEYFSSGDLEKDGSDNEAALRNFCHLIYTVASPLREGVDSKYDDYRFICGLSPNSEEAVAKLEKIVSRDVIEKLLLNGYEIVMD